jgi:hypothetical protein
MSKRLEKLFHKHLEEGEEILYIAHKHWFTIYQDILNLVVFGFLVPWFVWWFVENPLAMLVVWVLYMILVQKQTRRAIGGVVGALMILYLLPASIDANVVLFIVWVFYTVFMFVILFFDWYLDAWLLTNTSIIDVRWQGIFEQSVKRLDYKTVENVSYEIKGVVATLMGYGTIKIEQASGAIEISHITNPKRIEHLLNEFRETYASVSSLTEEAGLKDLLASMVKRHISESGFSLEIDDDEEAEEAEPPLPPAQQDTREFKDVKP